MFRLRTQWREKGCRGKNHSVGAGLLRWKRDWGCGFYYFATFVRVWRSNVTVWLKLLQFHERLSFICFSFYALFLCCCVCHCGLLCSPFLFLFPNERSGRIQYSYCRKVVPAPAAVSHIDDMCRAQGRGDPVWFIQHHQLLVYLPPAYTSAQRNWSREGLCFAARFCWMERNFKFKKICFWAKRITTKKRVIRDTC